jgi:hypothetical protein
LCFTHLNKRLKCLMPSLDQPLAWGGSLSFENLILPLVYFGSMSESHCFVQSFHWWVGMPAFLSKIANQRLQLFSRSNRVNASSLAVQGPSSLFPGPSCHGRINNHFWGVRVPKNQGKKVLWNADIYSYIWETLKKQLLRENGFLWITPNGIYNFLWELLRDASFHCG